MRRKAGDIEGLAEFLRESKLKDNRANPIGGGSFGVVYESDVPGNVIKQGIPGGYDNDFVNEADLQSVAADMGFAPRVAGIERFAGGIGDRIEMEDIRGNFENAFQADAGNLKALRTTDVRVAQQLGQLALKGVGLQDRNPGNVYKNKMTGRPMQIDFGIAGKVTGEDQVMSLADATEDGFRAAGIGDIGSIFRATVYDLLNGGQVDEAMDVAKQGFSRLQKIKNIV